MKMPCGPQSQSMDERTSLAWRHSKDQQIPLKPLLLSPPQTPEEGRVGHALGRVNLFIRPQLSSRLRLSAVSR